MSDPIYGKQYQLYDKLNATGGHKRFPITTIDSILGLSSYLHTQFSSLANIYMPIEGIHEAKTSQEFVYRATPNTIKANLLNVDRIKGCTRTWNQLADTTHLTATGDAGYTKFPCTDIYVVSGHKYLLKISKWTNINAVRLRSPEISNDYTQNFIITPSTSGTGYFQYLGENGGAIDTDYFIIDLTLLFNGNVPADYTVADFERDFPELYYPYDSGKLISNDARSVEITGRNVWDEEWELGGFNYTNGQKESDVDRIRCKNPIPVLPNTNYYIKTGKGGGLIIQLDANKGYISGEAGLALSEGYSFTTSANTRYVEFNVYSNYGSHYDYDIIVNISDTTFNGQYEPYWKKEVILNLDNFKVKSPNIWDEEWEVGGIVGAALNSKNYISVAGNTTYYFYCGTAETYPDIYFYDANKVQIGNYYSMGANAAFTTPSGCYYIKYRLNVSYGQTYKGDITINKSDPAFNGRYFSHADITITGGLKGNGDWADMIVGNKYVKKCERVNLGDYTWSIQAGYTDVFQASFVSITASNSICSKYTLDADGGYLDDKQYLQVGSLLYIKDSAHSVAPTSSDNWLDGTYLDYALTYPETYELAEPLVTSVRAGSTEARISPNAYGLSAPMVCDITYSVVQDAANAGDAQYSAYAGRLLNTRKIWGQDFDGTEDVSGSLSGVSNINGILNFDSNGRAVVKGQSGDTALIVESGNASSSWIQLKSVNGSYEGYFGINGANGPSVYTNAAYKVWHEGNSNLATVDWSSRYSLVDALFLGHNNAGIYLHKDGISTKDASNNWTGDAVIINATTRNVSFTNQIQSTLAEGTAPISVVSKTICPNLTAESAVNPKSELKTGQEIVFRKTNVTWDAKSGVVKKIKGCTHAVNNQQPPSTISTSDNGITVTASNSSKITVIVNNATGYIQPVLAAVTFIQGHKYLVRWNTYEGCPVEIYRGVLVTDDYTIPYIAEANTTVQYGMQMYIPQSSQNGTYEFFVEIIDLTLKFGPGNEPTTVAGFNTIYPEPIPYNPGTLKSNDAEGLESVGKNIWDEEWELGLLDYNGQNEISAANIRSKNYIPIAIGGTYMFTGGNAVIYCYASDKSLIPYSGESSWHNGIDVTNNTFVLPDGTAYVRFWMSSFYGTTYNHDICINLSDTSFNGQYEPYKKVVTPFNLGSVKVKSPNVWDEEWENGYYSNSDGSYHSYGGAICSKNKIKVFPNTDYHISETVSNVIFYDADESFISSATNINEFTTPTGCVFVQFSMPDSYGTTYNHDITINKSAPAFNGRYFPSGTLTLEGGVKSAGSVYDYVENGKYHKKIGRVDLGTLTYNVDSNNVFRGSLSDVKKSANSQSVANIISSNYVKTSPIGVNANDKTIAIDETDPLVAIHDSGHSTVPTSSDNWLEGVMLDYELQYEEVYELAESLPSVFPCDMDGTERVISPVSTTPSAPFCCDIQYGAKSDDIATDLISVKSSVQPLLDALEFDGPNNAWHLKGNLYADGFLTAKGINGGAQPANINKVTYTVTMSSGNDWYLLTSEINNAIDKFFAGWVVLISNEDTDETYSVIGVGNNNDLHLAEGITVISAE